MVIPQHRRMNSRVLLASSMSRPATTSRTRSTVCLSPCPQACDSRARQDNRGTAEQLRWRARSACAKLQTQGLWRLRGLKLQSSATIGTCRSNNHKGHPGAQFERLVTRETSRVPHLITAWPIGLRRLTRRSGPPAPDALWCRNGREHDYAENIGRITRVSPLTRSKSRSK